MYVMKYFYFIFSERTELATRYQVSSEVSYNHHIKTLPFIVGKLLCEQCDIVDFSGITTVGYALNKSYVTDCVL